MATISTEALQPTTTLPVTTVPDLSSQYTNNINSVANLTQQANDAAAAEKTAQDQYLAKANEKANLEASYGMKANDTANLYQTTGVNDLYKQISGINTEAQGLARQAQAIPLQTQQEYTGRLSTQAGTSAIDAGRLRENALKSLELGQRAAIAQGNYDVAKNLADQQIASKYAGIEAEIKSKQTNLEALDKITLTAAQEKRKAAQTALLTKQANDIAEQKANDKALSDIIIQASTQNAPSNLLEKAKLAKTPSEAAMILGQYAGDYYAIEKTKAEISKLKAEAYKVNNPTGTGSGSLLPANSTAQAYLDLYNNGSMSVEDIYTKIGSSKTAEVTKNELTKLIAAQGGKRVLTMDDAQVNGINEQIKNIDDLTKGSVGSIVGLVQGGLGISPDRLNTGKQDALAIASNLVANQTLQSLADAKAKGITFGALSEAELNAVASAASRVASKAIVDKETGKIKGFTGSEKEFIKDLNNIKAGLQKSIVKKTTSAASPVQNQVDMAVKALNAANTTNTTGGYIFK